MKFANLLLCSAALSACTGGVSERSVDVCDEAARHREFCTGEYLTPPVCDARTAAAAERLLTLDCEAMERQVATGAKADGAFCDWFGISCEPDEPLFSGPRCDEDSDCAGEGFCAEGRCFAGVASGEMQRALDELTGSRETSGSWARLHATNTEAHNVRFALIKSARHSIHLSALLIEDDGLGYETLELLADAALRGVEVRMIVDATTQYLFADYEALQALASAGVEILPYNPANEWASLRWKVELTVNQRFHEKLLIVDGADAIIGGRNWGDDYLLPGKWRDSDVQLAGPAVDDVQRLFLELWDEFGAWEEMAGCPQRDAYGFYCPTGELPLVDDAIYYPPQPNFAESGRLEGGHARIIHSDPRHHETSSEGYVASIALVRAARRSVKITNSYFVPSRRLRKHLRAAAERGVEVTVVTNSLGSTDADYMYYASLNYYEELIRSGVKILQYRGTETMHAKAMVIDDAVAMVGSYNMDPRSATSNSEAMVLLRNSAAVAESVAWFDADAARCDPARYEDITLSDWIKAKLFRLPEPLM